MGKIGIKVGKVPLNHYVIPLYAPFVPEVIWNDVMKTLRYKNTSKDVDRNPCKLG